MMALVLCLQACSLLPKDADPVMHSDAARERLQQWTIKARLTSTEHRGLLRWKQQADAFNILLRGPFGLGGVRIIGTPQRAEINDGEEVTVSLDPQADIYRRTGIWVPVAALPYWLRALPAPGDEAQLQRDELGRVIELRQFGWQVSYADWQVQDDVALPMQLQLTREQPILSLEISRWILP